MIAAALRGRIGAGFALDVAFDIPADGVTALLGPSGSGKTSVLRALAGLDRRAGSLRFADEVWQDATRFVPAERRRVAYVPQGSGLLPHLTIAANLDYAARRAVSGPFDRADVVARTGIAPLLHRSPGKLSGGERQRASIARALLGQPRLLLMDEPLSGLDGEARDRLRDELGRLFFSLAVPVIYVTHDDGEAALLAVRTLRLRDGRVDPG